MPFVAKRASESETQPGNAPITVDSCRLTNVPNIDNKYQTQTFIDASESYISMPINNIQLLSISLDALDNPHSHFTPTTQTTLNTVAYPYMSDLLALSSCKKSELEPPSIEGLEHINSPLIIQAWAEALTTHPDIAFAEYLLAGICNGFRVGFNYNSPLQSSQQNMLSANQNRSVVSEYLRKETEAGRILGPLPVYIASMVHTSGFGVIPKRHQIDKWCLILDLSHPDTASVSFGIDKGLCSLQYASIDDAARIISDLGPGTQLAKIDIAHAYRNVPVHPADRTLLGTKSENKIYIDTVLPFGLRSAPKIFCAISDTLEWILHSRGVSACLLYIDDFLTFGTPDSEQCARNLEILLQSCSELGIPLAIENIEGPSYIIIFLGIELDMTAMSMRLPEEKQLHLQALIQTWLKRKAALKHDLLSLIGQLVHACKVVIPGRIFLRRTFDLASSYYKLDHWIRLNEGFRLDLMWWDTFMESWNGVSLLKSHTNRHPDFHVFTDASGSWGCGAT